MAVAEEQFHRAGGNGGNICAGEASLAVAEGQIGPKELWISQLAVMSHSRQSLFQPS